MCLFRKYSELNVTRSSVLPLVLRFQGPSNIEVRLLIWGTDLNRVPPCQISQRVV